MKHLTFIAVAATAIAAASCCKSSTTLSGLDPKDFDSGYNGKATALYTLTNENGMEVCLTNFGGRIVSVMVPDKNGDLKDVVLGFDNIEDYFPENNKTDFGATIGRYANRIKDGKFTLDGVEYQLPQNNFGHCLHGGPTGWQYQVYDVLEADASHVKFELVSPDGDNGFPGTVTACVTYTLTSDNAIDCLYEATTDKPTVINMTNHSYFNLSGEPGNHTVEEDILWINASNFTPADSTFMPYGTIEPVAGTAMDFLEPRAIACDVDNQEYDQTRNAMGYDHNWVLDNEGSDCVPAVDIVCATSGIELIVYTNEPGIQIYSGNFLDGTVKGKKGAVYQKRAAICFESQKYPNSPNVAEWPSPVLRPGETYSSHCVYCFAVNDLGAADEAEE